jgi:TolA-binding protein
MVVRTPFKTRIPLLAALAVGLLSGCQGSWFQIPDSLAFWDKHEPKIDHTLPEDYVKYSDGQLVHEASLPTYGGDYEGARLLFREKDYARAEPIFGKIADNAKNTPQVLEDARFNEAECLYLRGKYPAAAERYLQLLNSFASAAHGEETRERLFSIANYWLDETREQMEKAREVREGKRWFTTPIMPVHFEESKPLLDIEGHAVKILEAVHITDPKGKWGEKALFYLGSVKFYREQYRDADFYFYQLVQNYANGPYAPKALELSIICKQICTGGPNYDGRRLQEARDLIEMAKTAYPELEKGEDKFLTKQAMEIHYIQAEKDYNIARFWERTGHPGSAHFYYEIVKRRYPGTPFAEKAEKKLIELKAAAIRESQHAAPANADTQTPEAAPPPRPLQGQPGDAPKTLPKGLESGR